MRNSWLMVLLASLLVFWGCPSNDDIGVDDLPGTVEVAGAEPCAPLVTGCWMQGTDEVNLYASTVEDYCSSLRAYWDYLDSEEYLDAQAALEAADTAEDGPGVCQATIEANALLAPSYDAAFPEGSCTLSVSREGALDGGGSADVGLMYSHLGYGDCVTAFYGDCSEVDSWATWVDMEDEASNQCMDSLSLWGTEHQVDISEEGENSWRATATDLELSGWTSDAVGTTVTVSFDFIAAPGD